VLYCTCHKRGILWGAAEALDSRSLRSTDTCLGAIEAVWLCFRNKRLGA